MKAGTATPKLIAVDLDGTLLGASGEAHDEDVVSLKAAMNQGVIVSILTGRLYSGTRQTAERVGITGPVGCVDGSHLVNASTHGTMVHCGIDGEHAIALRDCLAKTRPITFLFAKDQVVHDEHGDHYLSYVSSWSSDIRRTPNLVEHDCWHEAEGITAVVAIGSAGQIRDTADALESRLGSHAQVAMFPVRHAANQWGIVVRSSKGSKGTALQWLAHHHGITMAQTVVVGDWTNDIPMFEVAGRSYAMGQAPPAVKERAHRVLKETSFSGGGVAKVVSEAFGIRV